MSITRYALKAVPLAGLGAALAAALSGCGGATTSTSSFVATPDSSPVIYGLGAQAILGPAGVYNETSGLAYTDSGSGTQIGVLTAATAFKTDHGPGPIPVYLKSFAPAGIPLGFAVTGTYITGANAVALPTASAGAVVFRVYVSPGAIGGNSVNINTSSLVLTSSEAPAFSQPLTFDLAGIGVGPLGQGQYTTGTFALPATLATSGVHNLHAVVADTAGQQTETDFGVAVVAPADVCLFLQSLTANVPATATAAATTKTTAITTGDTVTIDGGKGTGIYPAGATPTIADAQGTVVLFTQPGTHTLTETSAKGVVVQTETFTLPTSTAGTTIESPPTPAQAASAARPLR